MSNVNQVGGAAFESAQSQRPRILPLLKKRDFDRTGKLGSNIAIAIEALWSNRLRSLLTTLGIFIGVAAVIAILFLTQGASASITNTITSLGTNTITIAPGTGPTGDEEGPRPGSRMMPSTTEITLSLTPADAEAVAKIPNIVRSSPVITTNQQVVVDNLNWNTRIQGVNTSYQNIQNWVIKNGAWFSENDERGAKTVAVLGYTTYLQLFGGSDTDPIGENVRIGNQVFRVVGVMEAKGGATMDDVVFVPFTTALNRLKNTDYVDQIVVQTSDANAMSTVQKDITSLLQQRHHIREGEPDDFTMTSSEELLETANEFTGLLGALLVGIAGISLTVGGIGIMNIMIVSVTERTREIGIRLSIGAQRQDIRNQFLIEALALSLLGGIIGILMGFLLGYALTYFLDLPFVISASTLLLPFVVSATIGIIFGFYPAARAAQLDPIEALRSL